MQLLPHAAVDACSATLPFPHAQLAAPLAARRLSRASGCWWSWHAPACVPEGVQGGCLDVLGARGAPRPVGHIV